MQITPEQARAELARRRAAQQQPQAAQPAQAVPSQTSAITPEMAKAELARRKAMQQAPAQEQGSSWLPKDLQAVIGGSQRFREMAKAGELDASFQNAPSSGNEIVTNVAQSIRERPAETLVQTFSPVAIGTATAAGTAAGGPVGGGAAFTGSLAAASATQRAAQGIDRKLFELTRGIIGNDKPKEGDINAAIGILFDQALGLAVPYAVAKGAGALRRAEANKLQNIADELSTKATTPEQIAKLNQVKQRLQSIGVTGEKVAQRLGDDQVFSMNNMRLDEAAAKIKGQGWESRTFGGTLTAGKPSDFGADLNVRGLMGKLSEQNSKRVLEIVKKDNEDYARTLLPPKNSFTDFDTAKSKLTKALEDKKRELRVSQAFERERVFAPKPANTPILGSELIRIFDDKAVVGAMAEIGAEKTKLQAMRSAVSKAGALKTTDLANVMSTIQSQFVTKDDAKARAVFYETVFPKIKDLFTSAAARPTGAATKEYANSVVKFFENRFGLADVQGDFAQTILENKPLQAVDFLSNKDNFLQAKQAFGKFADEKRFGDYLRTVIAAASKDAQGNVSAGELNKVLSKINLDVPEVVQALGKDYVGNLRALQTVVNAEAIDGTKTQLVQLAMGRNAAKAKDTAEAVRELAINTAAANPLGQGAAVSNIGRSFVSPFIQPDVRAPTISRAAISEIRTPNTPQIRAAGGAASAMAPVAAYGYDTTEEQQAQARAMLSGGQGGPEEVAPSMSEDEQRYNILMNGGALDPQQKMSDEIQMNAMMDDVDMLIRKQVEEDSRVVNKVSTRQEEGFRTSVYKDTKGFKTIGIGFNMEAAGARKIWQDAGIKTSFDDALAGRKTISKAEAESLFNSTKQNARNDAAKLVKNYSNLGQHQQDALTDMVFQLGTTGAMKFIRTRGLIEAGKFKEAAAAMMESANARQTPNRVMRRAYMLENNVSLAEADAALVKAGKISRKESINTPQELSRLLGETKVAAAAPAKPAPKKRVRYAEAKAKRGLA
jgi:lysozyme